MNIVIGVIVILHLQKSLVVYLLSDILHCNLPEGLSIMFKYGRHYENRWHDQINPEQNSEFDRQVADHIKLTGMADKNLSNDLSRVIRYADLDDVHEKPRIN
jgi:hypothetical protein